MGCPIRISTDQSLLSAPRGFSQSATSFIASLCQGIHQMPFYTLDLVTRRGKPCAERPHLRHAGSRPARGLKHYPAVDQEKPIHDVKELLPTGQAGAFSRDSKRPISGLHLDDSEVSIQKPEIRRLRTDNHCNLRQMSGQSEILISDFCPLTSELVEANGIEPMTSCLQSSRSPN